MFAWQKDFCYPAQQRLAEESGYSVRQVQRSLDELKSKKLIYWKRQGLGKPNIYYILPIPEEAPEEAKSEELPGDDNMSLLDTTPPKNPEFFRSANMSHPDRSAVSYPQTTPVSRPDTTPMSYKEYATEEYPNTVNVNDLPIIKNPQNPGIPPAVVEDLLNRIVEITGDEQEGSRRNFRKSVYALGQPTIEAILSELRTRAAQGEIERGKPQYFMWKCQEEAIRRGFLLWAPKPKPRVVNTDTLTAPPTSRQTFFDIEPLKGAATVGNRGAMRDLRAFTTEEEL
jgi:hypothetical protein